MDELEILNKLIEQEHKSHILGIQIPIWKDEKEKTSFIASKNAIDEEIEHLKFQLQGIENKKFSLQAYETIISQLKEYINQIKKAKTGLKLSRKQSMIGENMLISFIAKDVHNLLIDKVYGIHIPAYLLYTTDEDDAIEIPELVEFLSEQLEVLYSMKNPNYLKLRNFYDDLKRGLMERFGK